MAVMATSTGSDLNALPVFAAVAEAGGFTAAAQRLGIAKARVSVDIARLETQLGATLFTRTTRRVALTDAGQALYAQMVPSLRGLQDALAQAGGGEELRGTLRISAAVDYAAHTVAPAVAAFAAQHPGLEIDLRTSDRIVDMLKEGIDVALRMGWLRDSTLRAAKLGDFEQHVVASPAYLERMPRILNPADLATHEWVALSLLPAPLTWTFTSAKGRRRVVRVNARLRTDSVGALRGLLQSGCGVSVLDQFSTQEMLSSGQLVRVLPGWTLPRGGLHAVYPPGRYVPAKVRAFIDFYSDWLARR
jgi:DNA-binding transcriptional LysR family regulator